MKVIGATTAWPFGLAVGLTKPTVNTLLRPSSSLTFGLAPAVYITNDEPDSRNLFRSVFSASAIPTVPEVSLLKRALLPLMVVPEIFKLATSA